MAFEESADTIHGRLLESVHITGYTMERACIGLEWLLEDNRWKTIGDGFEDINDFLNTINLSQFKIAVDQRKKLARHLDEMQASQRATARALGVDKETIRRDLGVANAPEPSISNKEIEDVHVANAPLSSRPNPLTVVDGGEAARVVEKQATKAFDKAQLYGHDQGDEWYTPKWLFDALGIKFSIDVCAPADHTHVATPAKRFFSEVDDGLKQKWSGTIWCNPPYSNPEPWALKCVEHSDGLLLTHIPMNAGWCMEVWNSCDGIRLFQAMEFVRPDGTIQRPGTWLQLSAWGETATNALKQLRTPDSVAENPRRVPSPMWVKETK